MLAMLSSLVLQTCSERLLPISTHSPEMKFDLRMSSNSATMDYFSLPRGINEPNVPSWRRRQSSVSQSQLETTLASSTSSRGSWSSLFNTGTMRQFMTGVQDSFKDGLSTPDLILTPLSIAELSIPPIIKVENANPEVLSPGPKRKRQSKDSNVYTLPSVTTSKSRNEAPLSIKATPSSSSAGHRRSPLVQVIDPNNTNTKYRRVLVFDPPPEPSKSAHILFFCV